MKKKIIISVAAGCLGLFIVMVILLISPFFTPRQLYFDKVNKTMNKHCNSGLFNYSCKNPTGALAELKKIASSHPKYYYAYYKIGDIYRQQRDYENAIYYFKKAIEAEQVNPEAYQWLANCHSYKGQYDNAIETYKKGIEFFPKDGTLYAGISNVYLEQKKDIKNAIKYYSEPDILEKNNRYNLDSATLLSTLGRYNDSNKTLDKFKGTMSPLPVDCKAIEAAEGFKSALGCRFLKGSSRYVEDITGVSLDDTYKTSRFTIYGDNYLKMGNYNKAIEYLNKAEAALDYDEAAMAERMLERKKGRKITDAERKSLNKALETSKKYDRNQKETGAVEMTVNQRKLIEAYALKGDIKTANKYYEKYGANGNYSAGLYNDSKELFEGYISFAKGNYENAETNFKIAVKKSPNYMVPKFELGRTYLKQEKYEDAFEIFKRLQKWRWYDYEFNRYLAECYSKLDDEVKAQQYFEFASRLKNETK